MSVLTALRNPCFGTRWVRSHHCPQTKKLREMAEPGFEPLAAGWDALTLPLCQAAPPSSWLQRLTDLEGLLEGLTLSTVGGLLQHQKHGAGHPEVVVHRGKEEEQTRLEFSLAGKIFKLFADGSVSISLSSTMWRNSSKSSKIAFQPKKA